MRIGLALLLCLLGAAQGHAQEGHAQDSAGSRPWDLAQLMSALAQVRGGSAHFVEQKFLQVMSAPLQSSGLLRYSAPDLLEKTTLQPQRGRLLIAGDSVTIDSPGEATRTLSLQQSPELNGLVAGIRATMAGDLATLQRFYHLSLSGGPAGWQLSLVPSDGRTPALVSRIEISGVGAALSQVQTQDANGDRSVMTIVADPP